jgi:hypothetical protein
MAAWQQGQDCITDGQPCLLPHVRFRGFARRLSDLTLGNVIP